MDGDHPTITAREGPLGAYSAAKLSSEAFAYAYNQAFGLDTRIVRPSALYGFAMSWFAPNYMKNIVEPAVLGEPVRLRAGGLVPRDYTHAADMAGLLSAILAGPADADRLFYSATGQPLRTGGDVGRIVKSLIPEADIEIADEWTDSDRAELKIRGRISIDNAREQLGWEPRFAELEDGIADYIARLRAYLAAGGALTTRPAISGAPGS
jgi:nucleoside-diphosphate-sugar epimerase